MQIVETNIGYEVSFSYDYHKVEAVRKIPGAYYRGKDKTWIVPRHRQREIESLRQQFNAMDRAPLTPTEAALLAPEVIGEIPPLPTLPEELQEVIAKLPRKPFFFQETGVAYCYQNKRVLIGDQPGLGKTTQAAMAVTIANAFPCLVICPSSLKLNWQKEWKDVAGKRAMILNDKVKKTWPQYYNVGMVDVFIVNYESLKKYFVAAINKGDGAALRLKDIQFNETIKLFRSIIIDESHRCKDGSTQQTKFCMGIANGKEHRYLLSGTPVVNKPKDLVSQLVILDRLSDIVSHIPVTSAKDAGYTRFMNRYCNGPSGSSNLGELNYRLSTTCFYRREKTEVL